MPRPEPFQAQWETIAGWDWERIGSAVAAHGMARVFPAPGQRHAPVHAAEVAPEDVWRGRPAELAPEDVRSEVRHDVPPGVPAPLSAKTVERELYFAAALHAHCEQRGLVMGAEQDPEGTVWICVRRGDR